MRIVGTLAGGVAVVVLLALVPRPDKCADLAIGWDGQLSPQTVSQLDACPGERVLAVALRQGTTPDQKVALLTFAYNRKQSAAAARLLGEMYDPAHWRAPTSPFSEPNAANARRWYERAAHLGDGVARERLAALPGAGDGGRSR